jgi:geranylgeranyl diphosphate synthase type II
MDLKSYLTKTTDLIENHLNRLIQEQNAPFNRLFQAARYSLLGAGKRIRPIIALAACETFQGNVYNALQPACSLEMVHTYSLIHDDLPCMDNDDFRRGKPSLHKAFAEGEAVLAGDYLLTYAFEVLTQAPDLTSEQKLKLIATLSKKSGGEGMIAGQIMDIQKEKTLFSLENLRLMHRYKTGALIEASLEFGGIIAHASDHHMKILQGFGREIGLAFQIIDDILDVSSNNHKHGKAGSDIINQKSTYVTHLGLEKSQQMAAGLLDSSLSYLKQLPYDTSLLSQLATLLVYR